MSVTAELVGRARNAGLELIDIGATLRVCGPEPLPAALLEALRESKCDILEYLRCQPDPLPPEGDPRRVPIELIDQVWRAGGLLVLSGDRVRAVPRDDTQASLTPELLKAVEAHQAGLFHVLQRRLL